MIAPVSSRLRDSFTSRYRRQLFSVVSVVLLITTLTSGCSRSAYRLRADRDVFHIYQEKQAEEAYTIPPLPGVQVDPRSRFYDPSPADCPALPEPQPTLSSYQLPDLVSAPGMTAAEASLSDFTAGQVEAIPTPQGQPRAEIASPSDQVPLAETENNPAETSTAVPGITSEQRLADLIRQQAAEDDELQSADLPGPPSAGTPQDLTAMDGESKEAESSDEADDDEADEDSDLRIVPIPLQYWQELPTSCLPRMMEFDSVQQEFQRTVPEMGAAEMLSMRSDAPRLTLPMIAELATINQRQLQTQKERLFRNALALTTQRYDYVLRPTIRGNGTGLDYTHARINSASSSGLLVPTETAVTKTTATAGQFLAGFANDVVLTFNGPNGFAANVSSDLLFEFQQTIFQRDVVFEDLTQAERNVIYEARDLIRFQRSLFVDLATEYYRLLLTYRAIEISSQDYFSNLRAFREGRERFRQEDKNTTLVQVDQFEQNALSSRSSLVRACNALESDLDTLKLEIGLPPEMPINLDLSELEALTASDQLTVARQLVMRTLRSLRETDRRGDQTDGGVIDTEAMVNGASAVVSHLQDSLQIRAKVDPDARLQQVQQEIDLLAAKLKLLESRLICDIKADQLQQIEADPRFQLSAPIAFERTRELAGDLLVQAQRAIRFRRLQNRMQPDAGGDSQQLQAMGRRIRQAIAQLKQMEDTWDQSDPREQLQRIEQMVQMAVDLGQQAEALVQQATAEVLPADSAELQAVVQQAVEQTLELADRIESSSISSLGQTDPDQQEAMLLALYQRLDLANARGDLADQRRQIKLAADDLKSILDVRVSQRLSANRILSDPLDTSADGNVTRLSLALDTPLNRRIERNVYRATLIDYDQARRNLIQDEDEIKFAVREDLRQLRLRRNQYEISVARAALAYQRVVSTRMQLKLNIGNVVARDFLESQQAFTSALNSVAADHILFILDRIELFNDTESIRLNAWGYWQQGQGESLSLPPLPDFYDANPNPYGRIPEFLHYSDEVRQNH